MSSSPEVRVLGVDVGISGAAAVFCPRSLVPVAPRGIIRLPTEAREMSTKTKSGKKRIAHTINVESFLGWVQYHQPTHAFVEQVWAMPPKFDEETGERRDAGNTSSFNFGRAYGEILTVIKCYGIKPVLITSQRWQKMFGLLNAPHGIDKGEAARQFVLKRHPSVAPFIKFQKDHNSAEALLIAEYGSIIVERESEFEIED